MIEPLITRTLNMFCEEQMWDALLTTAMTWADTFHLWPSADIAHLVTSLEDMAGLGDPEVPYESVHSLALQTLIDRGEPELIIQPTQMKEAPMRVYVASSWRNPFFDEYMIKIKSIEGLEVYDFKKDSGFGWSQIDPDWQSWTTSQYIEALDHPLADAGFKRDMDALEAADALVLILPCGRSAHLELGYAVGAGKKTVILTRDGEEPELMAKMCDLITDDLETVCNVLEAWRDNH